MLTAFDWLRRCRSGAELLATLRLLQEKPDLFAVQEIGSPHSALGGPCRRCWIYPQAARLQSRSASATGRLRRYCPACQAVRSRAYHLRHLSLRSIVIWARLNRLPRVAEGNQGRSGSGIVGAYVHDQTHLLVAMRRWGLKIWLQELALYFGTELKGLIQILPTTGSGHGIDMGDVLCRAIHQEARFSLDRLRVRFFSAPYQVLMPHTRDQLGLLTFEAAEFLGLLETAAVFRTLLQPEAQQALQQLLNLADPAEEQFYWGRFLGYLSPEARDMLSAWRIRQWPKRRVKLLYELIDYVGFHQAD